MIIICKHVKYETLLLNRFPNPKWGIPRPALILEMLVFRFYFGAVPSKYIIYVNSKRSTTHEYTYMNRVPHLGEVAVIQYVVFAHISLSFLKTYNIQPSGVFQDIFPPAYILKWWDA